MGTLKAILFDIDGTLYRQRPLRARMLAELLKYTLINPLEGARALHVLRVFRRMREALREVTPRPSGLDLLQYRVAAEKAGVSEEKVRAIVRRWVLEAPLRHLYPCRYRGMAALLGHCREKGIRLGAFSDYPAAEKIDALGLSPFFELYLCSTDAGIDAFKPDPAGILAACRTWELPPADVAYVGDRADIDGRSAASAGTQFFHLKETDGLKKWISERI